MTAPNSPIAPHDVTPDAPWTPSPLEWMALLYAGATPDPGWVEFRALKGAERRWMPFPTFAGHPDEFRVPVKTWLTAKNVYYGVALRKQQGDGKGVDCHPTHLTWSDIDLKGTPYIDGDPAELPPEVVRAACRQRFEDLLCELEDLDVHARAIVHSGHGLQVLIARPVRSTPEDTEAMNRGLARVLSGDPAVVDRARILRLPGTRNVKNPRRPLPVEVWHAAADAVTADEALRAIAIYAERSSAGKPTGHFTRSSSLEARLLDMTLSRVQRDGRNNSGFWLACQLRDNRYPEDQALDVGQRFVDHCPTTDQNGRFEPYSMREFKSSLAQAYARPPRDPWSSRAATTADSAAAPVSAYAEQDGALVHFKPTREGGNVPVRLCNFTARVVAETTRDDGVERTTMFTLEGRTQRGEPLPACDVPAAQFDSLSWVTRHWGVRAIVGAGQGAKDHLRAAIQTLSMDPPPRQRVVYAHTGWREVGGAWMYLHAAGGITALGAANDVDVSLPPSLERFHLPAPPEGEELRAAVRASLEVMSVAPDAVSVPVWCAAWRAAIAPCDFAVFVVGPTGAGKSELAALAQQHYGADLDARHLPANWASTGNALEGLAFTAQDALLVVDDFAPSGSAQDIARYHAQAERLLRAQGNNAGRVRMRADASLRAERSPRGLVLSTGEDIPKGHSIRARALVLELEPDALDFARLEVHQARARRGTHASALAAFLQWLAPRLDAVRAERAEALTRLREEFPAAHRRTSSAAAELAWGASVALEFAVSAGAVTPDERAVLQARVMRALGAAASEQAEHHGAVDPARRFLELIRGVLTSGAAHLADAGDGVTPPANPARYGWRWVNRGSEGDPNHVLQAQGPCIGWIAADGVYLNYQAAYAAAERLADGQREPLAVTLTTLGKRLAERGWLITEAKRTTVKRSVSGDRQRVWHLRPYTFEESGASGAGGADAVADDANPAPIPREDRGAAPLSNRGATPAVASDWPARPARADS